MSRPVEKKRFMIHVACTEAMSWLARMTCIESALEEADQTPEKHQMLEERLKWIQHGLAVLSEEERKILIWITDGCTVDEMCEMTSREKTSLYKIRKRAMNKFAIALFGRMR